MTEAVYSYTHKQTYNVAVTKDYLSAADRVLITDDFLAGGNALKGLIDIANQAGAEVVGCCAEIEKGFQGGGDELRAKGYMLAKLEEGRQSSMFDDHPASAERAQHIRDRMSADGIK